MWCGLLDIRLNILSGLPEFRAFQKQTFSLAGNSCGLQGQIDREVGRRFLEKLVHVSHERPRDLFHKIRSGRSFWSSLSLCQFQRLVANTVKTPTKRFSLIADALGKPQPPVEALPFLFSEIVDFATKIYEFARQCFGEFSVAYFTEIYLGRYILSPISNFANVAQEARVFVDLAQILLQNRVELERCLSAHDVNLTPDWRYSNLGNDDGSGKSSDSPSKAQPVREFHRFWGQNDRNPYCQHYREGGREGQKQNRAKPLVNFRHSRKMHPRLGFVDCQMTACSQDLHANNKAYGD